MKAFSTYDATTGRILRTFESSVDQPVEALAQGNPVVAGIYEPGNFYVDNGIAVQIPEKPAPYHEFDYASKQWVPRADFAWESVRSRRNELLQQSDWTQLPDVPLATKEAWAEYRQALRDITDQPDPFNIVWPVAPG